MFNCECLMLNDKESNSKLLTEWYKEFYGIKEGNSI